MSIHADHLGGSRRERGFLWRMQTTAEQGGCAEGGDTVLDPNYLMSDRPLHLHEPSFPRSPNGANKTRESGEKETLLS